MPGGQFYVAGKNGGGIFQLVEKTPVPPGPDNFFDDTYWVSAIIPTFYAVWSTDRWINGGGSANLISMAPINGWEIGYNPQTMDVTVDDIPGGSSTFKFEFYMTNDPDEPGITGIALSNGQTYNFDLSSLGDTPSQFKCTNEAGGSDGLSITNIVFHT